MFETGVGQKTLLCKIKVKQRQHFQKVIWFKEFSQLEVRVLEMVCIARLGNHFLNIVGMYLKVPNFMSLMQLTWRNCTCWIRVALRSRRKVRLIFRERRGFPCEHICSQTNQKLKCRNITLTKTSAFCDGFNNIYVLFCMAFF